MTATITLRDEDYADLLKRQEADAMYAELMRQDRLNHGRSDLRDWSLICTAGQR